MREREIYIYKSIVLQCGPGRLVDVVPCFPTLQPRCRRTVHSLLYRSQARWCQGVEIRVQTVEEVEHCERDHQPAPCDGMFTDSMDHFQVWCGISIPHALFHFKHFIFRLSGRFFCSHSVNRNVNNWSQIRPSKRNAPGAGMNVAGGPVETKRTMRPIGSHAALPTES